jgi:hypothetical protein
MEENVLTRDLLRGTVLDESFEKSGEKFDSRKVKVKIIRRQGGWLPDDHEASTMMKGSKREYTVPESVSRKQLIDPLAGLSKEQKDRLAKHMGMTDGEVFNIYRKEDNYWRGNAVALTRDGDFYDLGKPGDFIRWCILRSNLSRISPTWNDKFSRGTYEFALVEENEENIQKISKADKMKEAYRLYGNLETSEAKMRDFLWVYALSYKDAKSPPKQAGSEFLKTQIADIVENYTDRFLELATDPCYQTKIMIKKAQGVGALVFKKRKFFMAGEENPIGGLEETIEYLDDDSNQDDRMKLLALIEKEKE